MNKNILKTGVQEFIKNYWDTDIVSVLLKKQQFEGVSQKELAEQLEAKKKCQNKLPSWFNAEQIYYPNKLNIEQTSSETTAQYKANLVSGKSLLDITGGFGIDSHFFAQKLLQIIHCELDKNLSEIASYNAQILNQKNIVFKAQNGLGFLENFNKNFDWIYADPSRRDNAKGKVFKLADCIPNIPKNLDLLFEHTDSILLKVSPLLDLTLGIKELKWVTEIHVIAVQNEVKEVLFLLRKDAEENIKIKTVNLKKDGEERFEFLKKDEKEANVEYDLPQKYLYEPNTAVLKSGGFKSIGSAFDLNKLHEHSHLYTSDTLINFPGRVFKIHSVVPYSKKAILKLAIKKANITTRNFPESVATIRRKLKIKDGGDDYLFFTTNLNNERVVVHCKKT
ncbi:hypothetical protein MTsPCn9_09750 [Croceitalea sp. MTPC9]|uniref:class I SAM-dependent methyltransferase n=1 Tax=unclassified Croceitalea TaxID=2632280 RepID=UPI002B3DCC26|nr:hypothetical protein MTsPCn6_27490 [Croceitalea sp. MTPC6]GMN16039.1 hypothetical protein MTsPCn9_09750 [Croceitalea sp. MTPC9]